MKRLIGIFLLFFTISAFAQKQEKPLVQFSGVVHNADSANAVVPYVNITNITSHTQGSSTNYKGYFSFVVHEQDTLLFTSVGYAATKVVIPANVPNNSYTVQVMIRAAIIHLPVFRVFPWATTEEFKKDFLSMKLADDELEIAKKNISRGSIAYLENTLPRDGQEIQSFNAQQQHYNLVNSHSITNPLLSPIAWGTLIKQISEGDKSRSTN
jgi:hypothetical protein